MNEKFMINKNFDTIDKIILIFVITIFLLLSIVCVFHQKSIDNNKNLNYTEVNGIMN